MTRLPEPSEYTSAPLRNRIQLHLNAPVDTVWALVGDHGRLPEYSGGIETVTVAPDGSSRTCRFRAVDDTPSVDLTERIRWEIPVVGYSASVVEPNPFLLTGDLSVVTVTATDTGTAFEWAQYFDSADVAAAVRSFDQGLVDMAERLIARFGGELSEQSAQGSAG